MTHYYHEVTGRIRFKTPFLKGRNDRCKEVANFLSGFRGIETVKINPLIGSVVVNYDSNVLNSKQILEVVSELGYFNKKKAVTVEQHLNSSFEKIGEAVGKAVLGAMVEQAFPGPALSLLKAFL